MYRGSFVRQGGTFDDPDYVYYNADIINNNTVSSDLTGYQVISDPQVRFNETRDKQILQNAGEYYFSVVRLSMNGTGRDLPLFIPTIQTGVGYNDVNLTTYGMAFSAMITLDISGSPSIPSIVVAPPIRYVSYVPETSNQSLAPTPSGAALASGAPQDINSRYYWVYSYQHWINLVNQTILTSDPVELASGANFAWTCCWGDTYQAVINAYPAAELVFPSLSVFVSYVCPPQITYNPDNNRFTIYGDSDGFGERLTPFTVFVPKVTGIPYCLTPPTMRFFMNANMFGLFSNISNLYWNSQNQVDTPFPGGLSQDTTLMSPTLVPVGYVNEILFPNKFYSNVADYRITPGAGIAPLGYVPIQKQKVYWLSEQEYPSTDSLWSPISTLVVTSSLLSIMPEYVSPPILLGTSNNINSQPTAPSAFDPIISDVAIDTALTGAGMYRQSVVYEPKAEFRLADFTTKGTAVRTIDIQIFWRCRLNGNLYPLQMYNLSSVSIKCMFKHKSLSGGKGAW